MIINDPRTLLDRWFGAAIHALQALPSGDGAIGGMMIVLPLFERYIQIKKNTDASGRRFYEIMAAELGLASASEADEFWTTFRHGFCHTGMPLNTNREGTTLPQVSFSAEHPKLPIRKSVPGGDVVFLLDPWKFIHHVYSLYHNDPTLLNRHPDAALLPIHILV
jgi:hypothetical protein